MKPSSITEDAQAFMLKCFRFNQLSLVQNYITRSEKQYIKLPVLYTSHTGILKPAQLPIGQKLLSPS